MKKLIIWFFFTFTIVSNSQNWNNVGSAGFSPGQANYTSLAINDTTPYVAFSDLSNYGKATLMKFDGTRWITVGHEGFTADQADYISLVFNGTTPYVAFQDWSNYGKATVMKYNGQNWVTIGTPGFSAGGAYYTSLAFNGTTPYVAYMDELNSSKASVMKYDGQNWVYVGSPGFSAGKAYYTPIAFNGTTPYIAYRDFGNASKATVMKFDGSNWVNVGSPGFTIGEADYPSIAFNGITPYLSFEDYGYGTKASVMKYDGQNWVYVGSPGFSAGWTAFTSLAFDGTTPYIAYWDGANTSKATVMKFNGQNWAYVGAPGFSAGKTYFNTFALRGSTPYVAYQDYSNSYKATVMKFDGAFVGSYNINLNCNPVNGGSVSGANTYYSGTQVTVSATENTGYSFSYWSEGGNIVSYNKNYTFIINSNRTLVANFVQIQFSVSVTIEPTNSGTITGNGIYNYGNTVSLKAKPNTGCIFANWTEGGNVFSSDTVYSFAIYSNRSLTAHFFIKPAIPTASQASSVTQTNFTANWGLVTGVTGYYLDVALDNQFSNILSRYNNLDVGNVNSYSITSLIANVTYYFRLRSYNASGTSGFSNIVSVTTLENKPIEPIAIDATFISANGFTANWNSVYGASGYYIDVAIDPNFENKVARFDNLDVGNVTKYDVTGLIVNLLYNYRIRAYNTGGTSGNSNVISVLATEVQNTNLSTNFQLYQNFPNPFNPTTQIRFSLPKTSFVKLGVYNTLGQEIINLINQELPSSEYYVDFNASTLNSGIYFYRIQTSDYIQTKKMILMK